MEKVGFLAEPLSRYQCPTTNITAANTSVNIAFANWWTSFIPPRRSQAFLVPTFLAPQENAVSANSVPPRPVAGTSPGHLSRRYFGGWGGFGMAVSRGIFHFPPSRTSVAVQMPVASSGAPDWTGSSL